METIDSLILQQLILLTTSASLLGMIVILAYFLIKNQKENETKK